MSPGGLTKWLLSRLCESFMMLRLGDSEGGGVLPNPRAVIDLGGGRRQGLVATRCFHTRSHLFPEDEILELLIAAPCLQTSVSSGPRN